VNKKFSIAFFGSSLVSAYWNGAATYYRGIIRGLHGRGHRTTFFEPDAFGRQQHRDIADPTWAKVVVYPPTLAGFRDSLNQAKAADIIVKASGVGVFDNELEAEIVSLKRSNNMILFWDVDAPATLDRIKLNVMDPLRSLLVQYDLVFTYGGGILVKESYEKLGARACIPIYNAFDPKSHFPVPPKPELSVDLSFIGNRLPDREKRVDEFFFGAAALAPRHQFLLGGSGWNDKPLPHNVCYMGHVFTRDHNVINCSARTVLNISRDSMARYGFSPATRIFEAAGAGACLITDDWKGIEEFLEPNREILVARNGNEVVGILSDLDRDRARCIGEAARKKVMANHTYLRRALEVEDALYSAYFRNL
jgi:spore maturation protein CgeB